MTRKAEEVMESLSVAEAKKNFSSIADRVARDGRRFVVMRRGKPVLALVSVEDARALEERGRPLGLAAAAGLLADAPRFLDAVDAVFRARSRVRDRPAPRLG
jgi:prevent-host-death family protein